MSASTIHAYAAGLFDGEGSAYRQATNSGSRTGRHHIVAQVVNTNLECLLWLAYHYGGTVRRQPTKPGRKPAWQWRVVTRAARTFLRAILPYLTIKRERVAGLLANEPD